MFSSIAMDGDRMMELKSLEISNEDRMIERKALEKASQLTLSCNFFGSKVQDKPIIITLISMLMLFYMEIKHILCSNIRCS